MGSEVGVCYGPNLGSRDYVELFHQPGKWADLRSRLSAFKVYADNVLDHAQCGGNTYEKLRHAGVFSKLSRWRLPLHLEAGVLKDWDLDGTQLTADVLHAISRVREARGQVDIVSMDEPLASTIVGSFRRSPGQYDDKNLHGGDQARLASNWAKAVQAAGPRVGLIEAYPYHRPPFLRDFVRDIVEPNGVRLAFFEIDLDLVDLHNQHMSTADVQSDLGMLRDYCHSQAIAFRIIVTGTHAKTPEEYVKESADVRQVAQGAGPFDGVTVQSWCEVPSTSDRQLPRNFPAAAATSHLSVLRAVLTSGLVATAPV